jgi:hypothetical protein
MAAGLPVEAMADEDILTVAQVAAQFGVTRQTVRSWIDGGKLKAGRKLRAWSSSFAGLSKAPTPWTRFQVGAVTRSGARTDSL